MESLRMTLVTGCEVSMDTRRRMSPAEWPKESEESSEEMDHHHSLSRQRRVVSGLVSLQINRVTK